MSDLFGNSKIPETKKEKKPLNLGDLIDVDLGKGLGGRGGAVIPLFEEEDEPDFEDAIEIED